MITINFSPALSDILADIGILRMEASTLREAIDDLEIRHGGIREKLLDEDGNLLGHINIYCNGKDIRLLKNLETPLNDGDEVAIIAAVWGG
jgi:molybdopterin converting factor small subunit